MDLYERSPSLGNIVPTSMDFEQSPSCRLSFTMPFRGDRQKLSALNVFSTSHLVLVGGCALDAVRGTVDTTTWALKEARLR